MAATTLLTSDQFLALPEEFDQDGNLIQRELINGEVVSMPHAAKRHDIIRGNILRSLIAYLLQNNDSGWTALPDTEFVVSANDTFIPDVCRDLRPRGWPTTTNTSRARRNSRSKWCLRMRARLIFRIKTTGLSGNGSHSVWIVFPEVRSVMVYTRDSDSRAQRRAADHQSPPARLLFPRRRVLRADLARVDASLLHPIRPAVLARSAGRKRQPRAVRKSAPRSCIKTIPK